MSRSLLKKSKRKVASPNKKRLLQNLALIVVVALLIAFVIYQQNTKEVNNTLYDRAIGDNATQVLIHSQGHDDIIIRNQEGAWKVIEPEEFIADKEKVRHLFTLLSENAETSYDIKGKDLASYGLDKDNLSVSFNGVKMIFGKLNEISQKRYILKGDKMYLISETVSGLMESGVDGFKPVVKSE